LDDVKGIDPEVDGVLEAGVAERVGEQGGEDRKVGPVGLEDERIGRVA
jgi:hypothetical protein